MNLFSAIITGVISFIATNIDDIFVLTALFAQADSASRRRHVVAGQYLGMSVIITFSIVGAFGALIVPNEVIGLLGVVPVYMGVRMFYAKDDAEVNRVIRVLPNPLTYKVAAITIGNGGDNLSIYIPMFVRSSFSQKVLIVIVFLLLTSVWCYIAYTIVWNPLVGTWIKKHGHAFIPVTLIGLGGYILWDNQTFALLSELLQRFAK